MSINDMCWTSTARYNDSYGVDDVVDGGHASTADDGGSDYRKDDVTREMTMRATTTIVAMMLVMVMAMVMLLVMSMMLIMLLMIMTIAMMMCVLDGDDGSL